MEKRYKILIVDDEKSNLDLLRQILKEYYNLVFARDGQSALESSVKHKPDLILLDIMMPGIDGYEVCRRLKKDNSITAKIPVIFVTAMGEIEDEHHGFNAGAVDYITKPVSASIVLARVKTHLSLVRTEELEIIQRAAIHMLGEAGHYNDTDTGVHIWRMAAYSAAIARAIGWSTSKYEMIELAAPMHDTGKIGIPDNILKAPRKLTSEEWVVMRKHTTIGYSILKKSDTPLFQMAADIALCHHEKWNGSGYPKGLSGEKIPESARIVAIADVFDALTMKRVYKEQWSIDKALETIQKDSGLHFDPELVETFFSLTSEIRAIKEKWDTKSNQQLL